MFPAQPRFNAPGPDGPFGGEESVHGVAFRGVGPGPLFQNEAPGFEAEGNDCAGIADSLGAVEAGRNVYVSEARNGSCAHRCRSLNVTLLSEISAR